MVILARRHEPDHRPRGNRDSFRRRLSQIESTPDGLPHDVPPQSHGTWPRDHGHLSFHQFGCHSRQSVL